MKKSNFYVLMMVFVSAMVIMSCGGDSAAKNDSPSSRAKKKRAAAKAMNPMDDTGIGPVKSLTLPADIDQAMVESGKKIYKEKCTACHKISKKFIGPSPMGILKRRNPAWIMNMILNPEEMIAKNAIAKKLLEEANGSPMANQNLKEEEARAVVEYFRTL